MLKQVWQDFFKGDITMMNKIIKRALMGFMYGVFIGQTIVLLESLFAGDGNYYALTTWLVDHTKSKLAAAFIQYLITGLIGTTFAAGTVIFEVQNWSLAAKTTINGWQYRCVVTDRARKSAA